MTTHGLHHVTAIAGELGPHLAFYRELLGLRLVKQTVNFDDPGTYHLYFGNESGEPGTLLTFFPIARGRRGRAGAGSVTRVSLAIPEGAVDFWSARLEAAGRPVTRIASDPHHGVVLRTQDPDGLVLDLVASAADTDPDPWGTREVDESVGIRAIRGVTMSSLAPEASSELLTARFGLAAANGPSGVDRFVLDEGKVVIDLDRTPQSAAHVAVGTVHHIAWRAVDDADQARWRERIVADGLHVTDVRDRHYFRSIYFREPGGTLFEIATDPPGMTSDEPLERLGEELKLPAEIGVDPDAIRAALPPLPKAGEEVGS